DQARSLSDHHRCGENTAHIMSTHACLEHLIPAREWDGPKAFFLPKFSPIIEVFITTPYIVYENIQPILFRADTTEYSLHLLVIPVIALDRDALPAQLAYLFSSLINRSREVDWSLVGFNRSTGNVNRCTCFT